MESLIPILKVLLYVIIAYFSLPWIIGGFLILGIGLIYMLGFILYLLGVRGD